jgi:hypothetical protein
MIDLTICTVSVTFPYGGDDPIGESSFAPVAVWWSEADRYPPTDKRLHGNRLTSGVISVAHARREVT